MDHLIHENAFKVVNGQIIIDEQVLNHQALNNNTVDRVRKHLSHLYAKNGKICFDNQSISIAKMRDTRNVVTLRGMFLDRNGVVLVRSVLDEKKWSIKREYLFGPECYPITGQDSIVYGRRNLEKNLNNYLEGSLHDPLYQTTHDPFRKLKIGDDIRLTIDSKLQRLAYEKIKGLRGAVVVLNVETGEILAAVSAPSFDPNTKSDDTWRRANSDDIQKPYENRAFSVLYPPGSTFKAVVAAAWLEHIEKRKEDKSKVIVCDGKKNHFGISDIYAHGKLGFDRAFILSCNQFFSEIGVELGGELKSMANRFGFNKQINLLPQIEEVKYLSEMSMAFSWRDPQKMKSSSAETKKSYTLKTYGIIDLQRNPKIVAQGAIGQNLIMATPLQMAMVAATVANRGVVLNPYLVEEIKDGKGKTLVAGSAVKLDKAMQQGTAGTIARLMEQVMMIGTGKNVKKLYWENGEYTTSPAAQTSLINSKISSENNLHPENTDKLNKRCNRKEIRVAGKTGTAEVGDRNGNGAIDKPHSWLIGFAPADKPKIAIAVVAENQGFGSLTAAPIAVDVLAEALNSLSNKRK
jgi:peptidoglycan glycosyltransferase